MLDLKADVLIVTATKTESKAVLEIFREATGQLPRAIDVDGRMYDDLGIVSGARIFMVQSEMGAGGLGATQQTVQKGISAISPSAVIMLGIAFGVDDTKQSIGDILVSERLSLYDLQRVGTDKKGKLKVMPRGVRIPASDWLLNRFRSADRHWGESKPAVQFGTILSGKKLVDNVKFRQELLEFEPEAIGGEMEGAGLYVACQGEKVDWILVKAICDWADGNKSQDKAEHQKLAAHNAASFVLHMLQQAPLKQGRKNATVSPPDTEQHSANAEAAGGESRSTLPRQPYFFGREKELANIADALSPESRSWGVLIDGPGGIGKTALAIHAGHNAPASDFPRKIFLSAKVRELTPAGEQPLQDYMLPNFMALLSELALELGQEDIARINPDERPNTVRRALADKQVLIVIDNLETFEEPERVRLYQFLSRLPNGCKAIVTSRRRTDIDARIIRLDRLELKDALDLLAELAKSNRYLARSSDRERRDLYEITQGNPLLIKWVVGQLGWTASRCHTITEACEFLKSAPTGNDPLEYIFGDLLDTFTESETAVLAALTHFTQPVKVEWIAELANLAVRAALTALEDLTDRALLVSDEQGENFLLPPLAAAFLRRKCTEIVAETGTRLADRAYALVIENGFQRYESFPKLQGEWPSISASFPLFLQSESDRFQEVYDALKDFLDFDGRWDEWLTLSQEAEEKALVINDYHNAGWGAFDAAWIYYLRNQAANFLASAKRCKAHWQMAGVGAREKALAIWLRGLEHEVEENYPAAIEASKEALTLLRALAPESIDVAILLNSIAAIQDITGDYINAEVNYLEALRVAKIVNYQEGIAYCTGNLAALALYRKDWPRAEVLAREALTLAEAIGRVELIGADCSMLSKSLVRQDRPKEGLPYSRRAVEIFTNLRIQENLDYAKAVLEECEKDL